MIMMITLIIIIIIINKIYFTREITLHAAHNINMSTEQLQHCVP
jgi:hypothetical protein